jgi:hypothetical protein
VQPNPVVYDVCEVRRSLWVIANRVTYLRLPRGDEAEVRP